MDQKGLLRPCSQEYSNSITYWTRGMFTEQTFHQWCRCRPGGSDNVIRAMQICQGATFLGRKLENSYPKSSWNVGRFRTTAKPACMQFLQWLQCTERQKERNWNMKLAIRKKKSWITASLYFILIVNKIYLLLHILSKNFRNKIRYY